MDKICQNNSGYSLGWKSFIVPAGYVYGTINGFNFIAVPIADRKFRKVPIVEVYQKTRKINETKKDYSAISSAIIDAILDCKTLKLSPWDYASDWEKAVKANTIAREHKEELREQGMIQSAHANSESSRRKPNKHIKKFLKWQ